MDIFSSAVLNRVVQDLKSTVRPPFLLNRYFGEVSVSTQEKIFFDVLTGKPRLAPFCSPLVEGQIVQSQGYQTNSFAPAYIKDKRVFEDGKPVRRRAGQPIYGALDPMTNRQLAIAQESEDQLGMLQRRMEWMAAEVLRTGKVTVSGEKYPTTVVDFGRDASLTVVLSGGAKWDQGSATPLADLESWAGLVRTKSGASPIDVIMAQNVWNLFREFDEVKDLLSSQLNLSSRTSIDVGPDAAKLGFTDKGTVGDYHIWIYHDQYVDEDGVTQDFLPDDYILMPAATLEGVQHYGAIKDEAAGMQALDYFSKSWTQPDPAVRFLMLQSAPLVVPYRVNATLSVKVK
ncbi:major capsid protein [Bradyrhizobium sp. JYMT SZCCT0428]|uniref:major capsid protein n=1 Tax=Bradyrhizobium sp. JYMT SZCCT0428 TaxID=2807673 RepID=UPI001BAC1569|nr:major capsid protein [Bradyrhizobium sp. JYMT SZCCT0428]MBR1150097.1 major capsid protein [Bradyrhizobium sp. JYMT SZCCT0428]